MPKYHRYRARYARPWHSLNSAIWLIGLGILFLWGHWWPGILVLIGLSIVLQAVFGASAPQIQGEDVEPPVVPPAPAPIQPVVIAPVSPPPANNIHRADLLPAVCPNCGGPARANEVKWTGSQSAACGYCGSTLPMKKS